MIASFLPDGDKAKDSRLRMSEVSRALLLSYGGTLTCLRVRHVEGEEAARLFALLRRQRKPAEVIVASEHISAFCQAIVEGCCRTVEKLELILPDSHPYLTNECTDLLAKAIAMGGLLPALRTSFVRGYSTQKERACWAKLAEVLAEGAAPQLRRITFHTSFDKSGIVVLADMLEARARISGCKRFQRFGIGNDGDWLDDEIS